MRFTPSARRATPYYAIPYYGIPYNAIAPEPAQYSWFSTRSAFLGRGDGASSARIFTLVRVEDRFHFIPCENAMAPQLPEAGPPKNGETPPNPSSRTLEIPAATREKRLSFLHLRCRRLYGTIVEGEVSVGNAISRSRGGSGQFPASPFHPSTALAGSFCANPLPAGVRSH